LSPPSAAEATKKGFITSVQIFFDSSVESSGELLSPPTPPKWLDKDLYLEGIKFFWGHAFMVFVVLMQSLITGLSVPNLRLVSAFLKLFNSRKKERQRVTFRNTDIK
jgi:hypothetical protein